MKKVVCLGIIFVCMFFCMNFVEAHPGKTDANGCHTCKTNCAKWGLSNGEYHCHDGSGSSSNSSGSSSSASITEPTYIYGCMDKNSLNYNENATKDDGSCIAKKKDALIKMR